MKSNLKHYIVFKPCLDCRACHTVLLRMATTVAVKMSRANISETQFESSENCSSSHESLIHSFTNNSRL